MTSATDADAAGRAFARWLAPYIAEELGLVGAGQPERSATYDDAICREYVAALGDGVVERADTMFRLLAKQGEVGAQQLADALHLASTRQLSGALTTALKRRAAALGLDPPWDVADGRDGRTAWYDREGIARRMRAALAAEQRQRQSGHIRAGS